MTCPDATGACTKASDGACTAPKTYGVFDPPQNVFAQGFDDHVEVTWDTPTDGSTVYNCTSKLFTLGDFELRDLVPADSPPYETGNYNRNELIYIFIRPESATEYGDWYLFKALVTSSWSSAAEIVTYLGSNVTYSGETVFYTTL